MTFTVLYDANILYPNTLRDLLIRIAQSGTVQAKWTNGMLDEMTAALRRNRPTASEFNMATRKGSGYQAAAVPGSDGREPSCDALGEQQTCHCLA
jgi:hypothetical protein